MTDPIKFTTVNVTCEGNSHTFKMQEGISIRDKRGKEFLYKDGKWQVWNPHANRTDMPGIPTGGFEEYEEYEGGFLGFFQKRKESPDIEISQGYMKCLKALMDNDGNKDNLTIRDIDMAREQYQAGKLRHDFAKHHVDVTRSQGEYSGYKNNKLQVDTYDGTFRIDYYN